MRNLVLLYIGQFISQAGDALFNVSVLFLVLLLESHSASMKTGFVSLLNTLPFLIFGFVAGTLVDRFNRKRLMLGSDLLRGLLLVMVPVAYGSGLLAWWVVAMMGFLLATFSTVFNPARDAVLPELAKKRSLLRVNAFFQTSQQLAIILGAMFAGVFLQLQGEKSLPDSEKIRLIVQLIFVDGITFFISFLTILFISLPAEKLRAKMEATAWDDIRNGMKYIFSDQLLAALLIFTAVDNFFIMGPAIVGANLFIKNTLKLGPSNLAFFEGSLACGWFVGTILVAKFGKRFRKGHLLLAGIILDGATYIPFLFIRSYAVLLAAIFIHAIAIPLITVSRTSIVQEYVPAHHMGKVFSLVNMTVIGSTAISGSVTGALGEFLSAPVLFFLAGIGGMTCGLIGLKIRSIRHYQ